MIPTQDSLAFDTRRAVLDDYLESPLYPARLDLLKKESLAEALSDQQIPPDTRLLTFETDSVLYVFPMVVVLAHNVIQGQLNGQAWIMTFCNACNTGMVFDPVVDGKTLHFRRRGSYDGLLLIWDEETDSYWQHITGQCLYGSSVGKTLRVLITTRQMTAAEAIAKNPHAILLTAPLSEDQEKLAKAMEKMRANPERVESGIVSTIGQEDTRRPRFELGLGVWNTEKSCFFPLMTLYGQDNVFLTEFDARRMLVYHAEEAIAPTAVYLDTQHAVWERNVLRLDNGASIQNDLYYTADGVAHMLERPMQLMMRWYGFALTFPGCSLPKL